MTKRVTHRLTGQDGIILEIGEIGAEPGALVQWLLGDGRRDGEPTWALRANLATLPLDADAEPERWVRRGGIPQARRQSE